MNTQYSYDKGKDTSFNEDYAYCDQCKWNGIPNQKIVIVYLGLRPANESGFIHKFDTYDYSSDGTKEIHRHKYDPDIIDHIIDQLFDRTKRMVE